MVPFGALASVIRRFRGTAVCYYHSYDFDGTTPGLRAIRSTLLAREVLGRSRIEPIFMRLARHFGSETCFDAAI
jgi:hypothetical protein